MTLAQASRVHDAIRRYAVKSRVKWEHKSMSYTVFALPTDAVWIRYDYLDGFSVLADGCAALGITDSPDVVRSKLL